MSHLTDGAIKDLEHEKQGGKPKPFWEAMDEAEAAGIRWITPVTCRHFIVTRVRGLEGIKVERVQREMWPGQTKGDTTDRYEHFDPEYL